MTWLEIALAGVAIAMSLLLWFRRRQSSLYILSLRGVLEMWRTGQLREAMEYLRAIKDRPAEFIAAEVIRMMRELGIAVEEHDLQLLVDWIKQDKIDDEIIRRFC